MSSRAKKVAKSATKKTTVTAPTAAAKPTDTCRVASCNRGHHCRELCHSHYEALARAIRNSNGALTWEIAEEAGACAVDHRPKRGNALFRHFPMLAGKVGKADGLAGKGEPLKVVPPATDVLPRPRHGRACVSCN